MAHVGSDSFTVPFTASDNQLTITVDCYVPGTRDGDPGHAMLNFDLNGISRVGNVPGRQEVLRRRRRNSAVPGPTANPAVTPGQPATLVVSFSQDGL